MTPTATAATPTSATSPLAGLFQTMTAAGVRHQHQPDRKVRGVLGAIDAGLLEATDEVAAAVTSYRAAVQSLRTLRDGQVDEQLPASRARAAQQIADGRALSAADLAALHDAVLADTAQRQVLEVVEEMVLTTSGQLGSAVRAGHDDFVEQLQVPWTALRQRWTDVAADLDGLDPRQPAGFVESGRVGDRRRAARDAAVQVAAEVAEVRRVHHLVLGLVAPDGDLGDFERRGLLHRPGRQGPVSGDALHQLVLAGVQWLPTLDELRDEMTAPHLVVDPDVRDRARAAVAAARPAGGLFFPSAH